MMTKYKVGDKLRFTATNSQSFSNGKIYEVTSEDMYSIYVNNNYGRIHGLSGIYLRDNFELVCEPTPVEASPTVIELLANLSRRLYEAEEAIKSQAYEINELYKADAERAVAER